MLTEVAWALGKIPDKRAIQPLYDLDKKLQAICDLDNMMLKKLKEAPILGGLTVQHVG